jgi:hypothetical protein
MEILSQSNNNEVWFMMLPVVFAVFWLDVGVGIGIEEKKKTQTIICSIIGLSLLFGSIFICIQDSKKQILKVLITDYNKVDFNKYIIEDNEGKIITLSEK